MGSGMALRLVLSAVFGLVLMVSLLLKLPGNPDGAVAAPEPIPARITALLDRHGFQVSKAAPERSPAWVIGRAGDCQIQIAEVALQGWHRSLIAQVAAGKQLFYIFDGETYPEQPVLRTRAHRYWLKLLHDYLALSASYHPALAVVATPACERLVLSDLADLSEGHSAKVLRE